jgi:hypothetical protein
VLDTKADLTWKGLHHLIETTDDISFRALVPMVPSDFNARCGGMHELGAYYKRGGPCPSSDDSDGVIDELDDAAHVLMVLPSTSEALPSPPLGPPPSEIAPRAVFQESWVCNTGLTNEIFVIDSGVSASLGAILKYTNMLINPTTKTTTGVQGLGGGVRAVARGQLPLELSNGTYTMIPAEVCPGTPFNLIAAAYLSRKGQVPPRVAIEDHDNVGHEWSLYEKGDHGQRTLVLSARYDADHTQLYILNGQWGLDRSVHFRNALSAYSDASRRPAWQHHCKLMHPSTPVLTVLKNDLAYGLRFVEDVLPKLHCGGCYEGGATVVTNKKRGLRRHVPRVDHEQRQRHLETLADRHSLLIDIWGRAPLPAYGGNEYALFAYLPAFHYLFVLGMRTRDQVLELVQNIIAFLERQHSYVVKEIVTDNEGNVTSNEAKAWFASDGFILRRQTSHVHHDGLGALNSVMRHVLDKVRTCIVRDNVPLETWLYCLQHVVMVRNLLPRPHGVNKLSPHELLTGKRPSLGRLHNLFSLVYVTRPPQAGQTKLDKHAEKGLLLGYTSVSMLQAVLLLFGRQRLVVVFTSQFTVVDERYELFPFYKKNMQNGGGVGQADLGAEEANQRSVEFGPARVPVTPRVVYERRATVPPGPDEEEAFKELHRSTHDGIDKHSEFTSRWADPRAEENTMVEALIDPIPPPTVLTSLSRMEKEDLWPELQGFEDHDEVPLAAAHDEVDSKAASSTPADDGQDSHHDGDDYPIEAVLQFRVLRGQEQWQVVWQGHEEHGYKPQWVTAITEDLAVEYHHLREEANAREVARLGKKKGKKATAIVLPLRDELTDQRTFFDCFSGTKNLTKAASSLGMTTTSLDWAHPADINRDFRTMTHEEIGVHAVTWCSPPCNTQSFLRIRGSHPARDSNGLPLTAEAREADSTIASFMSWWAYNLAACPTAILVMENPRGFLDRHPALQGLKKYELDQCAWNRKEKKTTMLLTHNVGLKLRPRCDGVSPGHKPHLHVLDQGKTARSEIPWDLAMDVVGQALEQLIAPVPKSSDHEPPKGSSRTSTDDVSRGDDPPLKAKAKVTGRHSHRRRPTPRSPRTRSQKVKTEQDSSTEASGSAPDLASEESASSEVAETKRPGAQERANAEAAARAEEASLATAKAQAERPTPTTAAKGKAPDPVSEEEHAEAASRLAELSNGSPRRRPSRSLPTLAQGDASAVTFYTAW